MSFPNDAAEASAYEWLKQQELSGKTSTEIFRMLQKEIDNIRSETSGFKSWK